MNQVWLASALLGLLLRADAIPDTAQTALPPEFAGFRSWQKLTAEPTLVPYHLSILCVSRPPTLANLKRHGPHTNSFIMVYANQQAAAALGDRSVQAFPPGAIIAKEKLGSSGATQADGVAFMVKRPIGQFTESGGWEFLYFPSAGEQASYDTCVSCHRAGATKDYVFGRYGENGVD